MIGEEHIRHRWNHLFNIISVRLVSHFLFVMWEHFSSVFVLLLDTTLLFHSSCVWASLVSVSLCRFWLHSTDICILPTKTEICPLSFPLWPPFSASSAHLSLLPILKCLFSLHPHLFLCVTLSPFILLSLFIFPKFLLSTFLSLHPSLNLNQLKRKAVRKT